jgi:hypothetical protein
MKLKELLEYLSIPMMGSTVSPLMNPGTLIYTQVVQPTTRQCTDDEQDVEFETNKKKKNKPLEQLDVKEYNKKSPQELKSYYKDSDFDPEDLVKAFSTINKDKKK